MSALLHVFDGSYEARRAAALSGVPLRPRDPRPVDAWDYFARAATHASRDAPDLYDEVKVTDAELASAVL